MADYSLMEARFIHLLDKGSHFLSHLLIVMEFSQVLSRKSSRLIAVHLCPGRIYELHIALHVCKGDTFAHLIHCLFEHMLHHFSFDWFLLRVPGHVHSLLFSIVSFCKGNLRRYVNI